MADNYATLFQMSKIERVLVVLSVAGILVSVYLTFKTYDPSSVACSIGGGCETVLSSDYAKLLGIPVSIFGIFWYVAMLGLLYFSTIKKAALRVQIEVWVVLGLLFSLPLLYLEAFVIHAYCTWCLVSLGIVSLMNILIFLPNKMKGLKK